MKKRKNLGIAILSMAAILAGTGVVSCGPKNTVVEGGISAPHFDAYLTQAQNGKEELVTTSRMTLLESGAEGVVAHSFEQPEGTKLSWEVKDAKGEKTEEVKIAEDGKVTLPEVSSRKDYTITAIATKVDEELHEEKVIKQSIRLTVVPKGSIATGPQDLMGLSTEELSSTFSGAEALALETGLAGMNFWAYGGYTKISDRIHTTRTEDGRMNSSLYVPGFGWGITQYGSVAVDSPKETNGAWKRYFHTENSKQPTDVNYYKSSGSDVTDRWSMIQAPLFGKLLDENNVDEYVPSMSTQAEPVPCDENGREITGDEARGLHAHWKVKVNVGPTVQYVNLGKKNGNVYNGRDVALEDYLTPYIVQYTQYTQAANVSQLMGTYVGDADYYSLTAEKPSEDFHMTPEWFLEHFPGITLDRNENALIFHLAKPTTTDFAAYRLNQQGTMPLDFIQDCLGQGDLAAGVTKYGRKDETDGSNPEDNILSTGPLALEKLTEDKIVLKRNPNWYVKKDSVGRQVNLLEGYIETKNTMLERDADLELQYKQYEEGYIDQASLPSARINDMKNDADTLYISSTGEKNGVSFNCLNSVDYDYLFGTAGVFEPHAIAGQFYDAWTLGSAGDKETRKAFFENDWDVKAIMSNHNFQKGLNCGYNRDAFAETLGRSGFSNYFGDINKMTPKADSSYNESEGHKEAVSQVFGEDGVPTDSNEKGVNYFKKAIKEELAAGHYQLGTGANPTVINLNVNWQAENWVDFQGTAIFGAIEQTIDAAIKSTPDWMDEGKQRIKIHFEQTYEGSGTYDWQNVYAKVALGQYDIAQASISGGEYEVFNETGLWESFNNDYSLTIHHALVTNIPTSYVTYGGKYYSLDAIYYGNAYGVELDEFGRIDYAANGFLYV